MPEKNISPYFMFRRISITLFKISLMFLVIFSTVFYIFTSLRVLDLQISDPWTAIFDLFLGISFIAIFIILYNIAHTRVGALLTFIALAFWAVLPTGNFIFEDFDRLQEYFLTTYYLSSVIAVFYLSIFFLGVLNFIGQTIHLIKNKRSGFWGPWFANYKEVNFSRMSRAHKRKVIKGIVGLLIVGAFIIPGIIPLFNGYRVPIEIRPQDYQVKFNFWASPSLSSYNTSVQQELNDHKVNLDLTFNQIDIQDAEELVAFETAMPDVTYRVTIAPSELADLPGMVQDATNILMAYEANYSLNNWRGFAFNIETEGFKSRSSYDTFQEGIDLWNEVFDWVENKSLTRNKTTEMECISYVEMAIDDDFDGDLDVEMQYGYPAFTPDRFTTYAPMLYRCQFEGNPPHGETADPLNDWYTSYRIYNPLLTLQAGVPERKLGLYLGITNLTCYSTGLYQPEPHTWPAGENNGFLNLARDVLVGKHFGIEEITFFLLQNSTTPNGFEFGGVFDAYGLGFLDDMNDTVNTYPPESFIIYYNHNDALRSGEKIRFDWYFDTSRPVGLLEIFVMWLFALVFTYFLDKGKKHVKNSEILEER